MTVDEFLAAGAYVAEHGCSLDQALSFVRGAVSPSLAITAADPQYQPKGRTEMKLEQLSSEDQVAVLRARNVELSRRLDALEKGSVKMTAGGPDDPRPHGGGGKDSYVSKGDNGKPSTKGLDNNTYKIRDEPDHTTPPFFPFKTLEEAQQAFKDKVTEQEAKGLKGLAALQRACDENPKLYEQARRYGVKVDGKFGDRSNGGK